MKITISMDDDIVNRLDDARRKKGNLARSTYIQLAVCTQIDQDVAIALLPQILEELKNKGKGGNILS